MKPRPLICLYPCYNSLLGAKVLAYLSRSVAMADIPCLGSRRVRNCTFQIGQLYVAGCRLTHGILQISLASTTTLGTFIVYLFFRYRNVNTSDTPESTGIRFLRTPAGFIFLNLLVADSTQALGFGLTWFWASRGGIDEDAHLCLFQALAIQAGDVASALFSFFIALYTAVLLTTHKKPSDVALYVGATCSWIFIALFTFLGPVAIATTDGGPFYAQAGNWCWISGSYADYRLWFHYLFVGGTVSAVVHFRSDQLSISAFHVGRRSTSFIPCYLPGDYVLLSTSDHLQTLIRLMPKVIRFRWVPQQKQSSDMEREQGGLGMDVLSQDTHGRVSRPMTSHTLPRTYPDAQEKSMPSTRMLDRTSLVMLLYPLVNLAVIMPLSVYRVMALAGQPGSAQALAACGSIFSLGGLANAILYTFSRVRACYLGADRANF